MIGLGAAGGDGGSPGGDGDQGGYEGGSGGGDGAENATTVSGAGETVSITTPSADERSAAVLVDSVSSAAWAVLSSVEMTCASTSTLAVESSRRRDAVVSVIFRMTSAAVT